MLRKKEDARQHAGICYCSLIEISNYRDLGSKRQRTGRARILVAIEDGEEEILCASYFLRALSTKKNIYYD